MRASAALLGRPAGAAAPPRAAVRLARLDGGGARARDGADAFAARRARWAALLREAWLALSLRLLVVVVQEGATAAPPAPTLLARLRPVLLLATPRARLAFAALACAEAFVCGTLEYTEAHHGDVQFEVLSAVCTLVAASPCSCTTATIATHWC